jgi:hypothetical protein
MCWYSAVSESNRILGMNLEGLYMDSGDFIYIVSCVYIYVCMCVCMCMCNTCMFGSYQMVLELTASHIQFVYS